MSDHFLYRAEIPLAFSDSPPRRVVWVVAPSLDAAACLVSRHATAVALVPGGVIAHCDTKCRTTSATHRLNLPPLGPPDTVPCPDCGCCDYERIDERRAIATALREWAQDYETQMARIAGALGEPGHFEKSRFANQLADEIGHWGGPPDAEPTT